MWGSVVGRLVVTVGGDDDRRCQHCQCGAYGVWAAVQKRNLECVQGCEQRCDDATAPIHAARSSMLYAVAVMSAV